MIEVTCLQCVLSSDAEYDVAHNSACSCATSCARAMGDNSTSNQLKHARACAQKLAVKAGESTQANLADCGISVPTRLNSNEVSLPQT